jgi:hypothetical protein
VIGWMIRNDCSCKEDLQEIKDSDPPVNTNEKLLNLLLTQTKETYILFLAGLQHTNQKDLYDVMMKEGL